jgi:hypothetical protein
VFVLVRSGGPKATFTAALGLLFQALIVSVVGLDWIQSIDPPFFSTSFGASLAVTQLLSALAWAAIVTPTSERMDAVADLGGLLLALVLGLAYLDFMTYLVIWYGDLPHKNEFFLRRETLPWLIVTGSAFALAIIIPTFSLFLKRVRADAFALRIVGVIVLVGVALQYAWLVAPAFGPVSLIAAALAAIVIGALIMLLNLSPSWSPLLPPQRPSHVE